MEALTRPRSPLIIAGEEFRNWEIKGCTANRITLVRIITNRSWGLSFAWQLGEYIPGLLEDGTPVEWYVSAVRHTDIDEYRVLLIPEVQPGEKSA